MIVVFVFPPARMIDAVQMGDQYALDTVAPAKATDTASLCEQVGMPAGTEKLEILAFHAAAFSSKRTVSPSSL